MTRALSTWKRYASMLVIFAIALGLRFQQTRNVLRTRMRFNSLLKPCSLTSQMRKLPRAATSSQVIQRF